MIGIDSANLGRLSMNLHRSSNGVRNSVGRLVNAGNATESLRAQGDVGGLSMVSRLGSDNRTKSALSKSMQNAFSYIQMQEAGLKKLNKIYNRMSELATNASNPFLDNEARANLNIEFQSLKQDTLSMRSETFQGNYLFDDMAAKYFPEVDFGKGFTDKSTSDGEVNVQSFAGYSGWNSNTSKRYTLEKEVSFNSGKFILEVNGGGSGERYVLRQGQDTLFDTAGGNSNDYKWKTEGTAYTHDFDRFEIEYAPGLATTFKFVPQSVGNSTDIAGNNIVGDGIGDSVPMENYRYDNKDSYIDQLGLGTSPENNTEENSKWLSGDDRTDYLFSGVVGEIQTYPALGQTTKLTLEVEADTIFQIKASYTPLDAPTNNLSLAGGSNGDVVLNAVGIGITMIDTKIDSLEDARQVLSPDSSGKTLLDKEMESLASQMATLGANMSKLEIAGERLTNQVYLSEMGVSRLTSNILADESTQMAKEQIKLQSSQALMAQAFSLSENILNTLL